MAEAENSVIDLVGGEMFDRQFCFGERLGGDIGEGESEKGWWNE